MAAQGNVLFHEKVAKLLSGQNGKPVLRPNKPLVLKDSVANRKMKKGEATCVTEMSMLMACWKQNNFMDALCSKEVSTFYTCVEKARQDMKKKPDQGGRLPPKQAMVLLKRYPTLRTEI